MPADFDKCAADPKNKVRTITLKGGKYLHVCYDQNGKSHSGEVKQGEVKKS
jgi:hypothetical protein